MAALVEDAECRAITEQEKGRELGGKGGERRVFLARRSPSAGHGGCWELPGGKQERGETGDEALVREIREELCVQLTITGPSLRYEAHVNDKDFVFLVFPSRFGSLDFTLAAHDEWAFFTAQEIQSLKLAPLDAPALRDWAQAQKEYSGAVVTI